jgi:Ca-activated chloride channel family protein
LPALLAAAKLPAPRTHAPAVLFGFALAMSMAAVARPVAPLPAPATWPVVLAIDVSRSMEETDIAPNRFDAAKSAADVFVRGLPAATSVALVSFGSSTTVVVPLTQDRDRILNGLANLRTELRTQLGTGLQEAVRVVAPEAGAPAGGPVGPAPSPAPTPGVAAPPPVGAAGPQAIVVLLTDGRASDGVPPLEAAREAREKRVRVYTVGMGTRADPSAFRSGYWGVLDEETLRRIAAETEGRYFHAGSASELRGVYRELARIVGWTRRMDEATGAAALAAAALLAAAVATQMRVFRVEAA